MKAFSRFAWILGAVAGSAALTSAIASDKINCLTDTLEDKLQVDICENLVDTTRLVEIDCNSEQVLEEYGDICRSVPHTHGGEDVNCFQTEDGFEFNLCSAVLVPETIFKINCFAIESESHTALCSDVSVFEQNWIRRRLR